MSITSEINTFVSAQNNVRQQAIAFGASWEPFEFNGLSGAVPVGGNDVVGYSTIAVGQASASLGNGSNAVILDGTHAISASTSGADSYSFNVQPNGTANILDNNTHQSVTVSGLSYLLFNGAATNQDGTFQSIIFVEGSSNSQIASLYNAAFLRQPDLPGLEYYAIPLANRSLTLHQAASSFLASPEFLHDYPSSGAISDNGGANDQAFITTLYNNVLHRIPAASEIAYYVADLRGTLPGIAQQDRAQLLVNFSLSPENQRNISAWLIDPGKGGYADSSDLLSADIVVTEGVVIGVVNTALIGNVDSTTRVSATSSSGNTTLAGAGYVSPVGTVTANSIGTTAANLTIYLSANINSADIAGVNDIIYSAIGGGSNITLPSFGNSTLSYGGKVALFGFGNILQTGAGPAGITVAVSVAGFVPGDQIAGYNQHGAQLLVGSASAPIIGSSYDFMTGTVNSLAINVGMVADSSAISMALAANRVYLVGDNAGESVTFFGQDPSGNSVVYQWALGDVNLSHKVDATSFTGAEFLIGVPAASITASMFH